ncbi:hypothetical protein D3C81_1859080 [compost metagenome]
MLQLIAERFTVIQNLSPIGIDQSQHHTHSRSFAGAVGTEQSINLALLHLQADSIHRCFVSILLHYLFQLQSFHSLVPSLLVNQNGAMPLCP